MRSESAATLREMMQTAAIDGKKLIATQTVKYKVRFNRIVGCHLYAPFTLG